MSPPYVVPARDVTAIQPKGWVTDVSKSRSIFHVSFSCFVSVLFYSYTVCAVPNADLSIAHGNYQRVGHLLRPMSKMYAVRTQADVVCDKNY